MNYISILEQCIETAKERQEQYGEAQESVQLACDILEKTFNIKLSIKEFCYVLVALKLSREHNKHKEDNILDAINYLAISLNSE